jgi:hypothetical protein
LNPAGKEVFRKAFTLELYLYIELSMVKPAQAFATSTFGIVVVFLPVVIKIMR